MKVEVSRSVIRGSVKAPSSKSAMQRILAGTLLADGLSEIRSPSFCEDSLAVIEIIRILKKRGLEKQKDVAALLDIDKSESSKLMNGEFNRFSEGRLIGFLNKLDYKVTMRISPLQKGEQPQQVVMV